jgi:hypothetical protein
MPDIFGERQGRFLVVENYSPIKKRAILFHNNDRYYNLFRRVE